MAKWGEIKCPRCAELEAENKRLDKNALAAYMMGVDDGLGNRANDVWSEFKDKWDGERKYALRQIVKFLKGEDDE